MPGGPFDLVLANLIASLLVSLAAELTAAVRPGHASAGSVVPDASPASDTSPASDASPAPRSRATGGRLLASGIFVDREPEVRRAFAAAGMRVVGRDAEGDWVSLDLERPAA